MSTSSTTPQSGVGGHPAAAPGPRAEHRRRGDGLPALAFLTPSIVTFLVFVLAPTVGVLVLSFYDWNLLSDGTFVGLDNFDRLAHDERLLGVYGSTTYMALVILAVNVAVGLLLAVLLETRMPAWLRGFFRLSFLFPFVVSASAVALIWRFLLNKDLGLVNYLLGLLHVDRIDWLGSSAFAPVSVILVSSWKTIGFSILVYIAGLQSIPAQLKEAAIVDGANAWTRFWRITFPLLSPTIFFLVVINTINSFQIFAEPRVLTQGGPGDASRTIVEYLYDRAFGDFDLGYASAIGITFTLVLIVLTAIQFRLSRRWTYYE
ncbi:sugar ABC transporter permease [Dactylosporangium sp. NPDC049525]|uniref:carbohydrate ABC transporter permease n=1 Tax=Dactylosporangium sp. NPDC049525 TaxID=3154730 RepID=UPI003413A3E3